MAKAKKVKQEKILGELKLPKTGLYKFYGGLIRIGQINITAQLPEVSFNNNFYEFGKASLSMTVSAVVEKPINYKQAYDDLK